MTPFAASIITLFPEAFPGPLGVSILERARTNNVWSLETIDLREIWPRQAQSRR